VSDERWRLECGREELAAERGEESFALLQRAARSATALRFGLGVLTEGREDGTPALRRRRLNAYMLLAGVVHETLLFAQEFERRHPDSEAFAAGFAVVLADVGMMAYAEDALGAVYGRAPFMFRTAGGTPRLPPAGSPALFGEGQGRTPGSFYYALPDEALLGGALGIGALTGADFYDAMKEHMESAALLAEKLAESADRVVAELLQSQPWRLSAG
jgi:hypothetical protein